MMIRYWAVARPQGARTEQIDSPHYEGPFYDLSTARDAREDLRRSFYHLDGESGWACYIVERPTAWRPNA
jgi:hypothetical protein